MDNKKDVLLLDLYIFEFFLSKVEKWIFNYISFESLYNKLDDRFKKMFSKEDVRSRIFYYNAIWKLKIENIPKNLQLIEEKVRFFDIDFNEIFSLWKMVQKENNWKKVFIKDMSHIEVIEENYYKYFLKVKITPEGISYIDNIKEDIKKQWLIYQSFNYMKNWIEKVWTLKSTIWIMITAIILIWMFVSPWNIKNILDKTPLLSSIIDSSILEWFEDIEDTNNEFYKNLEDMQGRDDVDNPILEKIKTLWIKDIKVKHISDNEKIYKIILNNKDEELIKITKNNGVFNIKYPNFEDYKKENIDKKELYEKLKNECNSLEDVNKRIKDYMEDVKYLKEHPESEYYDNLPIYQKKIDILKELRKEYNNVEF